MQHYSCRSVVSLTKELLKKNNLSLPPYLPLSDQLSLQMVDLEERTIGADGADRPDHPHRPPGRSGETFDLFRCPVPKPTASIHVTAAHGERLVQAVV